MIIFVIKYLIHVHNKCLNINQRKVCNQIENAYNIWINIKKQCIDVQQAHDIIHNFTSQQGSANYKPQCRTT